jgi:hypothetical protein
MQGICTYIPQTNHVPREYSVAAILLLLFIVHITLFSVLNLLCFYNSIFRNILLLLLLLLCRRYLRTSTRPHCVISQNIRKVRVFLRLVCK